MTLKELRESKDMTQVEAAKYLGMSTRSYQNYENNEAKWNTSKYGVIYRKLDAFLPKGPQEYFFQEGDSFLTGIVVGKGLQALYRSVQQYEKRDCYAYLKKYIEGNYEGKICILYGLRRTGKTTMLFQMIGELPIEKTAYIKVKTSDNMALLAKDLRRLYQCGYRYVFIDEITLLSDFIGTAAILSDIFSMMGMKIVLSGTDSLSFMVANREELYDRNIMIHTSFIPFREYVRLLKMPSIDRYIKYGGTLKMENMTFDDPDFSFDEVSFKDDESTRKYIDTAISKNIQHALKNDHFGEYFNQLRELYDQGELTNIINRVVESMNHQFLLKVVEERFQSHDLGSAKELLLHDYPLNRSTALYEIDERKVVERLKAIIEIKEKEEHSIPLTKEHLEKVKEYLIMLDLLDSCKIRYENGKEEEYNIFVQPGMRYSIAKALVFSLLKDDYFQLLPEVDKEYIAQKILEDVKGRMLEDIVLLETKKTISKNKDVFQFKFNHGGEFDMVIYDKEKNVCFLYEMKHSNQIVEAQRKNLRDQQKCQAVEEKYGKITGKFVIYRGKNEIIGDVSYINVEQYLSHLEK